MWTQQIFPAPLRMKKSFPVHLWRVGGDLVMGSGGGGGGGRSAAKHFGTQVRPFSDPLAQTAVLPVGTEIKSICCFTRAFPVFE